MLDIVHAIGVVRGPYVGDEDADHLGGLCDEAACGVVLYVVIVRQRLEDFGPGLLVHIRIVVYDSGHGGCGDAGQPGYLIYGHVLL